MPRSRSKKLAGKAARAVISSWLVLLASLCLVEHAAAQTVRYEITDLGTLGGEFSIAMSVNNFGEVVGNSAAPDGKTHAFLFSRGTMLDLGLAPGAAESRAHRIIDSGAIVGQLIYPDRTNRPFVTRMGSLWPLQVLRTEDDSAPSRVPPGQTVASTSSYAGDINSGGYVVGYNAYDRPAAVGLSGGGGHNAGGGAPRRRAFIYSEARVGFLDDVPLGESFATAINDSGQVVGYGKQHAGKHGLFAFIYGNGTAAELGSLGGATTVPTRISNAGRVVGHGQVQGGADHGFPYRDGKMIDLGTLPGGHHSFAYGINNFGRVVGSATDSGGAHQAFIYSGGPLRDLNELIPAGSGWQLTEARDINDLGQIVGAGIGGGKTRAFLLTPVRTAPQMVGELADALAEFNISGRLFQELGARLRRTRVALERRENGSAAEALDEFIALLDTAEGRKLGEAQAGALVAAAHRLRFGLRQRRTHSVAKNM